MGDPLVERAWAWCRAKERKRVEAGRIAQPVVCRVLAVVP